MFTAWSLVDSATIKMKEQTRTFDNVHSKALEFVNKCNDQISQMNMDANQTLEIDPLETALPVKRQRNKKRMADELTDDERNSSDSLADFRVNVFSLIMDRIVQSLESRFVQHKQLYKDLSCLDPVKFKTIAKKGLEDEALEGIIKLFPQISKDQVKLELTSFASNFDVLKLLLNDGENTESTNLVATIGKFAAVAHRVYLKFWHRTDFMTRYMITFTNFIKSSAHYQLRKSNVRGHFQS